MAIPVAVLEHQPASPKGSRVRAYWVDDRKVLTHGEDGHVRAWDLNAPEAPLWSAMVAFSRLALTPGGEVAVVPGSGLAVLIDTTDGSRTVKPLPDIGRTDPVRASQFTPDGSRLVVFTHLFGLYVFHWPELLLEHKIEAPRVRSTNRLGSRAWRRLALATRAWATSTMASRASPMSRASWSGPASRLTSRLRSMRPRVASITATSGRSS